MHVYALQTTSGREQRAEMLLPAKMASAVTHEGLSRPRRRRENFSIPADTENVESRIAQERQNALAAVRRALLMKPCVN